MVRSSAPGTSEVGFVMLSWFNFTVMGPLQEMTSVLGFGFSPGRESGAALEPHLKRQCPEVTTTRGMIKEEAQKPTLRSEAGVAPRVLPEGVGVKQLWSTSKDPA
jgi:hypothetical protein